MQTPNKIDEVAPDDPRIEKWIKSNKDRFKQRYGDSWEKVLYATAWKMFNSNKMNEELIDRSKMPQIKISDYKKLESYLAKNNVQFEYTSRSTKELKFVQEISEKGIDVLKSKTDVLDKPLIVSKDNVILDGNHRAFVNDKLGRKNNVMLLNRDFNDSYSLLIRFDNVEFKDKNNAKIK